MRLMTGGNISGVSKLKPGTCVRSASARVACGGVQSASHDVRARVPLVRLNNFEIGVYGAQNKTERWQVQWAFCWTAHCILLWST